MQEITIKIKKKIGAAIHTRLSLADKRSGCRLA